MRASRLALLITYYSLLIPPLFAGPLEDAEAAFNKKNYKDAREAYEKFIAAPEAKIVVAARHTDQPEYNPVGHPYLGKRLTLLTSYGHEPLGSRWDRSRSVALSIDLLRRDRLRVAPLVTHTFDRQELPDIYARLEQGDRDIVGAVFRW